MPGNKNSYAQRATLDLWLGGQLPSVPATVYVALSLSPYDPAATGAALDEITADSYARAALANTLANFPAAAGHDPALKTNGADIVFPAATTDWGTAQSAYYLDAAAAGNVLYGGNFAEPAPILSGDTPTIPAGSFVVSED